MMCAAAATPSGRSGNYAAARTPAFSWQFAVTFHPGSCTFYTNLKIGSIFLSDCKFNGRQVRNDSPFEPLFQNALYGFAATICVVQG